MRHALTLMSFVVFGSGSAFGGQGYDTCLKQEQELRAKEVSQCSGLQYLLNPSGCYGTQKALKEFDQGKCSRIGKIERVPEGTPEPHNVSSQASGRSPSRNIPAVEQGQQGRRSLPEVAVTAPQNNPKIEACRKQEQELRTKEADLCSGIKYLLTPSACFSAKKQLKEFDDGKCSKIEQAVSKPSIPQVPHAVRDVSPAPSHRTSTVPENATRVSPAKHATAGEGQMPSRETEQLKEENARIKAENERLKAELEQLRKNMK